MESGHAILSALLCVSGVFLPAELLYPTTGQYWGKTVLHIYYRTVVGKGSSVYFRPWLLCPLDNLLEFYPGLLTWSRSLGSWQQCGCLFPPSTLFIFKGGAGDQTQSLACWASPVPQNDFSVRVSLSSGSHSICRSCSVRSRPGDAAPSLESAPHLFVSFTNSTDVPSALSPVTLIAGLC